MQRLCGARQYCLSTREECGVVGQVRGDNDLPEACGYEDGEKCVK